MKTEKIDIMHDPNGQEDEKAKYVDSEIPRGQDETSESKEKPLPEPLAALQVKQCILAAAIAFAAIVLAIFAKQPQPLALLLASLYFFWSAWFVSYDWQRGRISQQVVVCTQTITRSKTTQIICRDQNNIYTYIVPDKKSDIYEGYTYIIWSHINNPKKIMAYQPL